MFPNGYLKDEPHDVTLARIGDTIRELGAFAQGSGVGVLMESHGDLTDSNSLVTVMRQAGTGFDTGTGLGHAPHGCRWQGSARKHLGGYRILGAPYAHQGLGRERR